MSTGWFAPPTPRILAHRGLALREPENTLPAFRAACDVGAGYLETDVRLTRDGVAVLAHDATFRTVAGETGEIAASTMDELRDVELGRDDSGGTDRGGRVGFVALGDVLEAFPEGRFNIDVKVDEAVPATVAAIRRAGAVERVLLASFSEARRRRLARELPGVATSPGRAGVIRILLASATGSTAAMRAALAGARALQAPERVVTRRLIAAVHAADAEVHAWTVNDPAAIRRLLALGVDGIVTDRADLAVPIARERI